VGTGIFQSDYAGTVTVRIPAGVKANYGVPNLPAVNFNNSNTTNNNWGNAFRGKGWIRPIDGPDIHISDRYLTGSVNTNITLVFETY
jgi:hypothetical protein